MKNLRIEKLYVADNGDIFIKTNPYYHEVANEEVLELIEKALTIYETGLQDVNGVAEPFEQIELCNYKPGIYPSYFTEDGEFIGHLGVHILPKYSIFQEFILIKTNNKEVAQKAMKDFECEQNLFRGI